MIDHLKDIIYERLKSLALEDKLLIGKAISISVQPLILLKKDTQLTGIYNKYLKKVPVEEIDGEKIYKEYTTKVQGYFEYEEYDEKFFTYLSFMAVQILANTIHTYKASFIEIVVSHLIQVSIVLDEYFYYLNEDNIKLEGIDNILKNISLRIMQNACEKLLINSIKICEEYGDQKEEKLRNEENKFKDELNKVLFS